MDIVDFESFRGKNVIVTGHSGFKGSWLTAALLHFGARIYGFSLKKDVELEFWDAFDCEKDLEVSDRLDITDYEKVKRRFADIDPDYVFHLAAQPLVRESYVDPLGTYQANTLGTLNICEAIRQGCSKASVVFITTDKVYENKEWIWGYKEIDRLNGFDPYSNSKSCAELIIQTYKRCYFDSSNIKVSIARAGNVIGGGDNAKDRIIPDCVRSVLNNLPIIVRNPHSVRPYQHVLEPIFAYLQIALYQTQNQALSGEFNIGPQTENTIATGELVSEFCAKWGDNAKWQVKPIEGALHEASLLKLDISKFQKLYKWSPKWNIDKTISATIDFYKSKLSGEPVKEIMKRQMLDYLNQDV